MNKQRCQINIGTSGYSYDEWIAAGVYPPGTRSADMLPLYAQRFPTTELKLYLVPDAKSGDD